MLILKTSILESFINSDLITETASKLNEYLNYLSKVQKGEVTDVPELFLQSDEGALSQLQAIKARMTNEALSHIVLIGIGGSNLGTKSIYDALYGHLDSVVPNRFPKMHFLETYDENLTAGVIEFIKTNVAEPSKVLFIVITKSGTTSETITLMQRLKKEISYFNERLVIITTEQNPLWHQALDDQIPVLTIPTSLSGRYAVFSAVGLFPISLFGLDLAPRHNEQYLSTSLAENPSLLSATCLYLAYQRGLRTHNTFIFEPALESWGLWYRQLLAESIGKNGIDLTPTVSIGTRDLHRQLQLYLGGENTRLTTFIHVSKPQTDLNQKQAQTLESVQLTYQQHQLPYFSVSLSDLNLTTLSELMQFKMIEVCLLAKLFGVNAFDQPDVDKFKSEFKNL